jgi:predicted GIY-YIG superfamily endonuclease
MALKKTTKCTKKNWRRVKRSRQAKGTEPKEIKLKCPKGQQCYVYYLENAKRTGVYIGYTTDFKRRIRQHNGEIKGGARRTKRKGGPWKFAMILSFPASWFHKINAMRLEKACQRMGRTRKFYQKRKLPSVEFAQIHIKGRPSVTDHVNNLLWGCYNRNRFTKSLPEFDAKNEEHCMKVYMDDSILQATDIEKQFSLAPFWSPKVFPLSSLV